MKKIVLVLMCVLLFAGCGEKEIDSKISDIASSIKEEKEMETSDFYGTWVVTKFKKDNSTYTIKEIESLGVYDLSGFYMVLKEGNSAYCYITSEDSESTGTWNYDKDTGIITIGTTEYFFEDNALVNKNDENVIFLERYSYSQDITDIPKAEEAKETIKEEVKEETKKEEPVKEEKKEEPVKEEVKEEPKPETGSTTIRPEIKEAIDAYEAFIDEYCAFMEIYNTTDDTTALLMQYMSFLSKLAEMETKMDNLEGDLTDAETLYYAEVMLRCSNKLLSTY